MTTSRIEHVLAKGFQRIALGENGMAECAGGVSAFRIFIDKKDDFVHIAASFGSYFSTDLKSSMKQGYLDEGGVPTLPASRIVGFWPGGGLPVHGGWSSIPNPRMDRWVG